MRRPRIAFLVATASMVSLGSLSLPQTAWGATAWKPTVAAGSKGEAHSQTLPTAPSGPTAACTSPATNKTVKVSWTAVTHATGYTVWVSTTSATGTYTTAATGVTATSWTSGTLTTGNYWYEVSAAVGSNWASAKSSATSQRTISSSSCA